VEIKEIWPALGAPIVGLIMGIYHKYIIHPLCQRIDIVEKETVKQGEMLARIDERTEWIKNILDKKYNGKKR